MGLGQAFKDASKAVSNVTRAASWALENPDKVVKGAAKVGEYALEHPGEVGKIAAKSLTEEFTNPVNLAINAALLIGTAGTATAAKAGAKVAAETAVKTTAKVAGETAAKTGAKVATETAAKTAAKTGAEVGTKTAAKVGAETAAETGGKTLGRLESFAQKLAKEPGKIERALNPLETSKWGMNAQRAKLAEKIAPEGAGIGRQIASAMVQGVGRNAPTQAAGVSDSVFRVQRGIHAVGRINRKLDTAQTAAKGVEVAAHPGKAALEYAEKNPDAVNKASGGSSDTQVSQQQLQPLSQPVNNTYTPGRGFQVTATPVAGGTGGQPPRQPPTMGGTSSGAYGGGPNQGMPTSSNAGGSSAGPSASLPYRAGRQLGRAQGAVQNSATAQAAQQSGLSNWMAKPARVRGPGQHMWQGPNREFISGISPGYDWREGYMYREPHATGKYQRRGSGSGEEAEQPGAYEVKSGQQPMGALNPGAPKMTELGRADWKALGPGPRVHFGTEQASGARPMGAPKALGMGGRKASFYEGSSVIDANSSSDDDYKFQPGGQGYLDFPDLARAMPGPSQPSQPKRKAAFSSGAQQTTLGI